ncbi:MAG: hypothetical protein JXR31_15125 [Prolixibacteraceae bacterium]|nr:hypothetical protein [Prolixibacteraceae bacterium]MBN2775586.1 hypothetical protein [Prolixibacteraceae bacterium]
MRTVLQIILFIVALGLAYLIYSSIQKPLDFDKAKTERYNAVIEKLKDIRRVQVEYKNVYGRYTGSMDTLINFIKYDSVKTVFKRGMVTDSMIEKGIDEKKALKLGLIIRDTSKQNVLTYLFTKDYPVDDLKYVPNIDEKVEFHMGSTIYTTGSGIKVPIFEAKAHNNNILKGLDEQLIINLNDERRVLGKYPGLSVGSLTEANNNAGNWE